jgi:hypothetical protein
VFADECGQTLKAHKATTWAPKGETPVAIAARSWLRVYQLPAYAPDRSISTSPTRP